MLQRNQNPLHSEDFPLCENLKLQLKSNSHPWLGVMRAKFGHALWVRGMSLHFFPIIQSDTSQSRVSMSSCMQESALSFFPVGLIWLLPLTFLVLILYVKAHVSPSNSVPDIHSLRSSVMLFTSKPYTSLAFMGQNCLFCLQRCISIRLEKHVCGKAETNGKVKNVTKKKR